MSGCHQGTRCAEGPDRLQPVLICQSGRSSQWCTQGQPVSGAMNVLWQENMLPVSQ